LTHLFYCGTNSVTRTIRGLIKGCWEPHKGCFWASCGPQKRYCETLV